MPAGGWGCISFFSSFQTIKIANALSKRAWSHPAVFLSYAHNMGWRVRIVHYSLTYGLIANSPKTEADIKPLLLFLPWEGSFMPHSLGWALTASPCSASPPSDLPLLLDLPSEGSWSSPGGMILHPWKLVSSKTNFLHLTDSAC